MPHAVKLFVDQRLTGDERQQVLEQLRRAWVPNSQVLWTGMSREVAQAWADQRGLQTLSTAMGPLMNTSSSFCPRKQKSPKQWSTYVHGASAIFAWLITEGESVIVLSRPPPVRFHPSEATGFQKIEQPIIKGNTGNKGVDTIRIVHPRVPDAADFTYELWPEDGVAAWVSTFGTVACTDRWRDVRSTPITGVCEESRVCCRNGGANPKSRNNSKRGEQSELPDDEKDIEKCALRERHAQETRRQKDELIEAKKALGRKQAKECQDLFEQQQIRRGGSNKRDNKGKKEVLSREVKEQKQLARKHRKEKRSIRARARADAALLVKRQQQESEVLHRVRRADSSTSAKRQKAQLLPPKREFTPEQVDRRDDPFQSLLFDAQGRSESDLGWLAFVSRLVRRFWGIIESLLHLTSC